MYDWKEIALMYKEEANRLCDEMHEVLEHVSAKVPHSIPRAEGILKVACINSDKQLEFIESFESSADKTVVPVKKPKHNEVNRKRPGMFIKKSGLISEEEYENLEELCAHIHDTKKKAYEFMDKCAVQATINWLKEKEYPVTIDNVAKIKKNIITVVDKSGKEKRIKVIASGLEFSGRTRPFGQELEKNQVTRQYTYLVDPKEHICDMYVFSNFVSKNNTLTLYAWTKGDYIKDMLVDPLRERFVGSMACILQKQGYNSNEQRSFSIDELILRS
jgi:hypothetical protein